MNKEREPFSKDKEMPPPGAVEEIKAGRFSLTPEEEKQIMAKAKIHGEDPAAALEKARAKMAGATSRLRSEQSEKAVKELEKQLEEEPETE